MHIGVLFSQYKPFGASSDHEAQNKLCHILVYLKMVRRSTVVRVVGALITCDETTLTIDGLLKKNLE